MAVKYQQKVNGTIVGESEEKDKAIRAARKAALALNDHRGLIHVEVYKIDDDKDGSIENIHRDLVLGENLKLLVLDVLKPVGLVSFTIREEPKKKPLDTRPLYDVGDYVILDSELHQIVAVTDSRAMAQPVRKKQVTIKDKFADKESGKPAGRSFNIRRKPVQLSPHATGVLTAREVKLELKKIEELENDKLNKTSEEGSKDNPRESGHDSTSS